MIFGDDYAERRIAVATRIAQAEIYKELLNELAKAGTVEAFKERLKQLREQAEAE